jgi:hypothetical protein
MCNGPTACHSVNHNDRMTYTLHLQNTITVRHTVPTGQRGMVEAGKYYQGLAVQNRTQVPTTSHTGTEEYSLAQQYVFKLIKPGYMFQLYKHHQDYLQSLVELYMLNTFAVWDPSNEVKIFAMLLGSHTAYAFNIYSSTSDCR